MSNLTGKSFFDFDSFYDAMKKVGLERWQADFERAINEVAQRPDGNLPGWIASLAQLPDLDTVDFDFSLSAAKIGNDSHIDETTRQQLKQALLNLCPWRKGPFNVFGINLDTEWRSDQKWQRVAPHISPLNGRKIIDIGCGNGYYMLRMLGMGADFVMGVDPSLLFLAQFKAITKYCGNIKAWLLPIGFEALPSEAQCFDTLFSMGVFYHRRSPFDFLRSLKMLLRKGGEMILETLVIEGDENQVLVPGGRYARMNNVWFIPSVDAMRVWLEKSGFDNIRVVDSCPTTIEEQRSTQWMPGESLTECLNQDNHSLTIEGYPAPVRAVFIAERR